MPLTKPDSRLVNPKIRLWTILTLGLSIAIHAIIFNTFTFVYTSKAPAFKPKFVFLGSILKPKSLLGHSRFRKKSSEGNPPQKIGYQTKDLSSAQSKITTVLKPLSKKSIDSNQKTLIKSTFEIERKKIEIPVKKAKNLEILTDFPPYKPLQLHTR